MLNWAGETSTTPEQISSQVYTPGREGTLQTDLISAARRQGMLAVPVHNLRTLLGELAAGHPVLVLQNLGLSWYPRWHYAVAIGYNLEEKVLFLHSGVDQNASLSLDTFEHTWARGHHWGILVLPHDLLPATVPEEEVVTAAAGLEQSTSPLRSEITYRKILQRWPKNLEARIGLANSYYARQDLKKTIAELKLAVSEHPSAAPAWHNLAIAFKENQNIKASQDAARKALNLSLPSQRELYQKSFVESGVSPLH